ncbi:MAG: hypothetical protein ACK5MY_01395 [Jhaorihella sp.]
MRQLEQVARAQYLREIGKIREILDRETALRTQLNRLSEQAAQARHVHAADPAMQSLGADMAWQGWLGRSRARLNTELAQVMAQKLVALDGVRTTFGRQQAVQTLAAAQTARESARLRQLRDYRLVESTCAGGS